MRKFKHKNGSTAKSVDGVYQTDDGYVLPAWIVEQPDGDWQEVTKDYEVLKVGTPNGDSWDAKIITNLHDFLIHTVKRLSDGEVFSINDWHTGFSFTEPRKIDKIIECDGIISFVGNGGRTRLSSAKKVTPKPDKDYEILSATTYNGVVITEIHVVKRLSDGEVFSVDDINPDGTKIKAFKKFDTGIHVDIGVCFVPLSNMRKRKPILTTEDGVELFEGDEPVRYHVKDDVLLNAIIDEHDPVGPDWKYFSTMEAAEDYRFNNVRLLSLNDVDGIYDLTELVKSRL